MGTIDTLSVDNFGISVEQTIDSLTYTVAPRDQPKSTSLALACVVLVSFGYPLGTLAIVVTALLISSGNRPAWELALTGLFVFQLGLWLVRMGTLIRRMISGSRVNPGVVLAFTGESVKHGSERVCDLVDIRGLRLFVYPLSGDPPGRLRAALSLVIGDENGTHGLLGRLGSPIPGASTKRLVM
jgi:hypothetical protein